jgi:hypothetical protein
MLENESINTWILRGLGTLLGVLVPLVIVALDFSWREEAVN